MQAMRPIFADLLQELQRSLSYASSSGDLDTIVGIGSTFKIPGLRKFIGQQLQVNISRLDEFKRIDVTGREAASFAENCVNMGTAYGLALQGIGLGEIDINLVPFSNFNVSKCGITKRNGLSQQQAFLLLAVPLSLFGPFMQERQLGLRWNPTSSSTSD